MLQLFAKQQSIYLTIRLHAQVAQPMAKSQQLNQESAFNTIKSYDLYDIQTENIDLNKVVLSLCWSVTSSMLAKWNNIENNP